MIPWAESASAALPAAPLVERLRDRHLLFPEQECDGEVKYLISGNGEVVSCSLFFSNILARLFTAKFKWRTVSQVKQIRGQAACHLVTFAALAK